ncbi:MAG: T9SS type A sorting domain-containing protein, partial [Mariniphaga sp.]|nr:T9SS type A sorting domain-containing protein [Mariniphaga sp.]
TGIYEYFGINPFNHMLLEYSEFSYQNDAWAHSTNTKYYYSPIEISNVEINKLGDFNIYPNPATEHVTLEWVGDIQNLDLKIFNNQGKIILRKKFTNKTTIQTSELPAGIYFYKVSGANISQKSGKIIIK